MNEEKQGKINSRVQTIDYPLDRFESTIREIKEEYKSINNMLEYIDKRMSEELALEIAQTQKLCERVKRLEQLYRLA
jgi:archaellum component FlaC